MSSSSSFSSTITSVASLALSFFPFEMLECPQQDDETKCLSFPFTAKKAVADGWLWVKGFEMMN